MTIDTFAPVVRSITSPISNAIAITPDNSASLDFATRAIWVGGAGNLTVDLLGGDEVTLSSVPAGTLLPIRVIRVRATGTTATAIVGLW